MLSSLDSLRFFSLAEGGPLYRIARRLGAVPGDRGLMQLGMFFAAITWGPLVVS